MQGESRPIMDGEGEQELDSSLVNSRLDLPIDVSTCETNGFEDSAAQHQIGGGAADMAVEDVEDHVLVWERLCGAGAGLLQASIRAAAGLIAKPLAALLDGLASTSAAVASAGTATAPPRRVRPPRVLAPNRPLPPLALSVAQVS